MMVELDESAPPSLQSAAVGSERAARERRLRGVAEPLLAAALAAHKGGTLDEFLGRRPARTRRLAQRLLPPVWAVAGDALAADALQPSAWRLLMRAALVALRPDRALGLGDIEAQDWIHRTRWRPLLALMCHAGFEPVPDFPEHYRARPGEPAAERLCGLWSVGPSTFYRYVEKGRRLLADVLLAPARGDDALARDARLQHEVRALLVHADGAARVAWHARQAAAAIGAHAGRTALWHLLCAGDAPGFITCLKRFRIELASDPDTDALLQRAAMLPLEPRRRAELALARSALAGVRGDDAAEHAAAEDALRIASSADDALMLGIVYGMLGKFHEARDPDKAFACYQDSADFLHRAGLLDTAGAADAGAAELLQAHVNTLVRLGWLYVLRNDPRSKAVLDGAEALRERCAAPAQVAELEQAWGEYWRRAGDLPRALEHKHRALQIYERLGDREAILKTYGNLSLVYGDARQFARAIDYSQRVLDMAARFAVAPETVAATLMNLGAAYFWQGKYEQAIDHYGQALAVSQRAALRVFVGRGHYNLAEAHYKRFLAGDDPEDERLGDAHIGAALACWPDGGDPAAVEATRALKREILGPREGDSFHDRLLPAELAAHFDEMTRVQRQRAALAMPLAPERQVAAQLELARAYLQIAVKERETAVQLIERHGLGERFAGDLRGLRDTFERQLSREQRLAATWRAGTGDLLDGAAAGRVLQQLIAAGAVGKSAYAGLCGVALATASKHLGRLVERGLLVQVGRGPSTRYVLPAKTA